MCGIGGVIATGDNSVSLNIRNILDQMSFYMKERGPDFTGNYLRENIGFVHTRLSIIDLSNNANQPFISKDTGNVIVFNGEIYNFQTLKHSLKKLGRNFVSNSDTEVILYLYEEHGIEGTLKLLDGMFAFAIYDKGLNKVYLGRDFFGKKPLYYFHRKNTFAFCSDIRPISSSFRQELSIDMQSIDYYLTELSMPQPKTIWKEVRQVLPQHFIEFSISENTLKEFSYNRTFHEKYDPNESDQDSIIANVDDILTKAILKRTIADVEVGCFLSGGVDSGLISSILAANSATKIKTFTVGIKDSPLDESELARVVVDKYDTEHTEMFIDTQIEEDLDDIILATGEPFADASIIPTYLVTREISSYLKVALSGDGGDEMFGGYPNYALSHKGDWLHSKYRNSIIRGGVILVDKALSKITNRENYGAFDDFYKKTPFLKTNRGVGLTYDQKTKLYNSQLKPYISYSENHIHSLWNSCEDKSTQTKQLMETSLKTRLLNDYLVKVDRLSMFNSLEVRSPLLDSDLYNYVKNIPDNLMFKGFNSKYILKKLATKYFDEDIFKRKKMGFEIPLDEWLRTSLRQYTEERIFSPSIRNLNIFNEEYIRTLWNNHLSGSNHRSIIWGLVCLSVWSNEFL